MGIYVFRRWMALISVLLGILIITFILARAVPGDPCSGMLGPKATPELCARFIKAKGLDQPIPVQFGIYVQDAIRGDFGDSIRTNWPVVQTLVERRPATVELSLAAF